MATELVWDDAGASMPAPRIQQALGWIVGLLLPLYLLDESVANKGILSPVIGAACVTLLLPSRFNMAAGSALWRLLALGFVLSYIISLFASVLGVGVNINAFYPLLFLALCFRIPFATDCILRGLFISLLAIVLFGWVRFIAGEGGDLAEHALGYWGIKYTESTRNSDALAPLMVTCIAVVALTNRTTVTAIWPVHWFVWLSLFFAFPALLLTYSRGAWLAAICFTLLNGSSNWRAMLKSIIALASGVVALLFAVRLIPDQMGEPIDLARLSERFVSILDPQIESSNRERGRLIEYAIRLGLENPFFGAGTGRFNCCVDELGFRDLLTALHPENLFLHLFSELGIVVGVFSFAILVVAGLRGLRSRCVGRRMAGSSIMAFVVWLHFNSELPSLFVWTVLGIACSVALSRATVLKIDKYRFQSV